jgi:putative ABC transport system substrate-binding protein
MKRRAILASSLAALAASPTRAQRLPLIGYLGGRSLATDAHLLQAAKDGLRESGFVEGQNVAFEYR